MRRKSMFTSVGILFAITVFGQVAAAAVPCESLASLSLPYTTITSAQTVFGSPILNINSTSFGRITTASGSRRFVVNARLNF